MKVRGRVQNGVVVLEAELRLPEGTVVTVSYPDAPRHESGDQARCVQLPLIPSKHPGSISLTAERVAELLEDVDVPS